MFSTYQELCLRVLIGSISYPPFPVLSSHTVLCLTPPVPYNLGTASMYNNSEVPSEVGCNLPSNDGLKNRYPDALHFTYLTHSNKNPLPNHALVGDTCFHHCLGEFESLGTAIKAPNRQCAMIRIYFRTSRI
jgi:hypothetical protein